MPSNRWEVAQGLIKKSFAAGCPVLMVTTDRVARRNQETLFRLMKSDTRECSGCHDRSSFAARSRAGTITTASICPPSREAASRPT
jgi:hypothetical protein